MRSNRKMMRRNRKMMRSNKKIMRNNQINKLKMMEKRGYKKRIKKKIKKIKNRLIMENNLNLRI